MRRHRVRTIKANGLELSALTLDTAPLVAPYGIPAGMAPSDETACKAVLAEAAACGIVCFETQDAITEPCRPLGRLLSSVPKPLIVCRIAVRTADYAGGGEGLERSVRLRVERALGSLNVGRLPIALLHVPDRADPPPQPLADLMRRLIAEGMIGRAGLSLEAGDGETMRKLRPLVGLDVFEAVHVPVSLLDQRLIRSGGLGLLRKTGKIVFARNVFAGGLLVLNTRKLPAHLREWGGPLDRLRDIAEEEGVPLAQLALSFLYGLEGIHSVVVGTETTVQLLEWVSLAERPAPSDRTMSDIVRTMADVPRRLLNALS
ncbi:aldo/keto reductase [Paenibacillus flagellatus]|uniref:NADP-dependent oxidoreductase domain-containing protein n=1 Tax=Paenibacillus flagellatus TaxID=2211139 RepID=A0A2V5KBA0_9BACL|nr:aldo/keto reductase [Paenibacillus flagellatus]PYI56192.1 hypothetical protein DLM86_04170 [Paenibacillus flagellatus]